MKKPILFFLCLAMAIGSLFAQPTLAQPTLTQKMVPALTPKGFLVQPDSRTLGRAVACGDDTVYYPFLNLSGTLINLWGEMGGNGFFSAASQVYQLPQGATISLKGFAFEGRYQPSGTSADISLEAYVYLADSNRLPTGNALANTQVIVDTSSRADIFYAVFASPVSINEDFALVLENPTDSAFSLGSNNIDSLDGRGQFLAGQRLLVGTPGWTNGQDITYKDSLNFDVDWLIYPIVSFEIEADYVADRSCLLKETPINFTNTSSPILGSPFFNRWVYDSIYNGTENRTIGWDLTASGVIQTYGAVTQQSYPAGGDSLQEVLMRASNFGYTAGGLCSEWRSRVFPSRGPADPFFNVILQGNLSYEFSALPSPANESYFWDFGDGSTDSTGPVVSHTFSTADTFTVTLTTTNCGTDSSLSRRFLAGTVGTNVGHFQVLDLFPNPASDRLNIGLKLDQAREARLWISDLNGRILKEKGLGMIKDSEFSLDLRGLQAGLYLLGLKAGEEYLYRKVVLE